jgi:hypothetical protein
MPGRAGKGVKTAWAKPELIVLVRRRPEEAVLQACKFTAPFHVGHTGLNFRCEWNYDCGSLCTELGAS